MPYEPPLNRKMMDTTSLSQLDDQALTERESKAIIHKVKAEKLRRVTSERYKYYVPTGVNEEFINAVGADQYFILLFSAANGVGKTGSAVNILANIIWPGNNPFFTAKLYGNWPYPKRIRIVSEPTAITGTIIPELKNWFPKGRYRTEKKGKNFECYWETDNGWIIDLMTYDQDPKEFESATIGLIWCDEPPPEIIYKANISRLRKGGFMFVTATPISGASAYLYDEVVSNPNHEPGSRYWLEAPMESSCIEHGVRGFLHHKDIERIAESYSEDEKQARVYGKFQHLVGLVFKQWSPKVHVIRPFPINPADYTIYEALDPHPRNPDAMLWVAVDKYGQKFVIDELWQKVLSTKELAQRIKQKQGQYRAAQRSWIDPSAFNVNQHDADQRNLADRLKDYGVHFEKGSKQRTASDRRVAEALDFQMVPGQQNEFLISPELYVFDTCKRTIFEIEHYRWDEWTGKMTGQKNAKEKPVDKDDHMIENLGRILIQEPQFEPYQVERIITEDTNSKGAFGEGDPYA